ncbi:MAG TPA: ribonuclease H-like domain-containing protein [Armatimonadota bacterium]|nr:ribonuclease H-like domain-containing protein [Armatimonadota bacterium]
MLEQTFCHIPGIGEKTEHDLWAAGIHNWREVADRPELPPRRAAVLTQYADESLTRLEARDVAYFSERLPANQHWRLFPHFRDRIAYLDIETTGLGNPGDHITTIALYDGHTLRHYVYGDNLPEFAQDIRAYDLLVTFNGKCFDIPFIEAYFGISLPLPHIDLRYVFASLGYQGGLKNIERTLGFDRGELADVDGYFAVILWHDYAKRRNHAALETLIAYNMLDAINLEALMVTAYNRKIAQTPFAESLHLPTPVAPSLPFTPDMATITRLRRNYPG